jgi:zinc D-Ala-D-Ala carboxypeptidase
MKITKNFSLEELIESNTALRRGIDNNPDADHIHNLVNLCEHILQPLRDKIGKPIRITSGYRSEALNEAIGGSKTSDHSHGRAADIKLIIDGQNRSELLYLGILEMNVPFKQMIWEFGDKETPQWVHIAFDKDNNKKECLRAYKDNGKTKYSLT